MQHEDRTIVVINTLGQSTDGRIGRRLARADVTREAGPRNLLDRLLGLLGDPGGAGSAAALRYLGQTGKAPPGWIAAADPVYLEPRLDHLCLHTQTGRVTNEEAASLVDHLNTLLEGDRRFLAIESRVYVEGQALPTASLDPDELHGYVPDRFIPSGSGSDAYRRFVSEVEMALHEHPVNLGRQARGGQPLNGLWFWGGGELPEPATRSLPLLVSNDPLLRGLWSRAGAESADWSGAFDALGDGPAVIVVPETEDLAPQEQLESLLAASRRARIRDFWILTRDGLRVRLRRSDRLRFWRRAVVLPGTAP